GLSISDLGVTQSQTRVDALLALDEPQTAADLTKFLGALNWMKSFLGKNYQKYVGPLLLIKQRAAEMAGSQKSTKLKGIDLKQRGLWDDAASKHWKNCLSMVAKETLTLAHPDGERCNVHIFTDASDNGWG